MLHNKDPSGDSGGWCIILLDESDGKGKVEKQNASGWNVSVDSERSATQHDRRL